eukprot:GEMP01102597.1.p1 GENE.GEMP01102597.1~~GEMP01102597.1.p1  ORF type:complete len:139 (-),score=1.55 GEMP01102597.1:364-780(-)
MNKVSCPSAHTHVRGPADTRDNKYTHVSPVNFRYADLAPRIEHSHQNRLVFKWSSPYFVFLFGKKKKYTAANIMKNFFVTEVIKKKLKKKLNVIFEIIKQNGKTQKTADDFLIRMAEINARLLKHSHADFFWWHATGK